MQKNIFTAVKQNNPNQLFNLLENKGLVLKDYEVKDEHGNSPLFYAVSYKFVGVVKALLEIGVDVNQQNSFGNTALHRALLCAQDIDGTNERIINMLLNNGVMGQELQKNVMLVYKLNQ
jgi:ankyrin repeat protein